MKTDIYAALSGAQSAWRHLEVISNNLANTATTGFRESRVSFEGATNLHARISSVKPSTADGALMPDNNPSHLALRGDAFFALADGTYTRDGAFRVDGEGNLVTTDGTAVLGEGGPLNVDPAESFSVRSDGSIVGSVSGEVGKLSLVSLSNTSQLGGNRWSGTANPAAEGVSVVQGALEASNADPMRGMVELIEASRFFESQQKAIQTSDEMRQRLNRIGGS